MDKQIKFPARVLTDIKTHLEEEKLRVNNQISDLSTQDPFADTDRLMDNAASDAEASEEINHERYQALVDELKKNLDSIQAALARIEKGSYGFCTACKSIIDTDRLAAIPTATLCMKCEAAKKH